MSLLNFTDILKKAGLDPAKVKLIRHALTDKGFKSCYDTNMVYEYTCHQKPDFSKGYEYWAVFISDKGSYAKLYALYKVGPSVPDNPEEAPIGFPHKEWFQGNEAYYDLQYVNQLHEYEGRLVIDWGKSARMWHQKATTEKPVISIEAENKKVFPGFENLILNFEALKEVLENDVDYDQWHAALMAINAVYLIVDTVAGMQYVGSSHGKDGLLGRWRCYVDTLHGNNKLMKELICSHPERYRDFQFSILQVLPKTATKDEIIHTETLWKKKLYTMAPFGMNSN